MYKTDSKSYCNKISVQSVKDSGIKEIISALQVRPQVAKKMEKTKTLQRKGTEVYQDKEKLSIGS